MSAPPPVPSKAALHALRGLLFGTSCSLVLVAEERRQRIKIARSAVENGRKLKSLKRYSTNGRATIEALQEEVRTDPDFSGWSRRSKSRSSAELYEASQGLGPDPRRPTRPKEKKEQKESDGTAPVSRLSGEPRHQRPAAAARKSQFQPVQPIAPTRRLAHTLDEFLRDNPHLGNVDGPRYSPSDPNQYAPTAAVDLVRRAQASVADSREPPDWLIKLSTLLCIACQQEGHYTDAGEILRIVVNHGPISLGDYLAHRPMELMEALILEKFTGETARTDHIRQIRRLYLADIADIDQAPSRVRQQYIAMGKNVISRALELQRSTLITEVFGRVKYIARAQLSDTTWFICQLAKHNEYTLAIDTFVSSYQSLRPSFQTREMCDLAVDCVIKSHNYAALEVLDTMCRFSQRDGWLVESTWVESILWQQWERSRGYTGTLELINHVLDNDFYGIEHTYAIRHTIVRIRLAAHDLALAKRDFESFCIEYPNAWKDMELRGAFAKQKASKGLWDAVRADFNSLKALQPFPEEQRVKFNAIFVSILEIYSKSHTWGETETFLETYIQELGVTPDRYLVRFIADRHGKCHDIKAMVRWLRFCRGAGYQTDPLFWHAVFKSCKRDWTYSDEHMRELYLELSRSGVSKEEFAAVEKVYKQLSSVPLPVVTKRVRLNAHRFSPADERKTYERMLLEAQHENWGVVNSIYNRAVHNNMGFSSRCLRLAVQASISSNGIACPRAKTLLSKAQSDGHDISNAVIPVVFAKLDQIEKYHQAEGNKGGRGWPFHDIKGVLFGLQSDGIHIADSVFDRAARVCLTVRNYREAITICVTAANTNGHGDLCYSLSNFKNLLHAYTARHEYDKLRWVISQLAERQYRFTRACRQSLNWAIRYLRVASQSEKAEELIQSDLATLDFVKTARDALGKEHHTSKADAQEEMIDAATGRERTAEALSMAKAKRAATFLAGVAAQQDAAAAELAARWERESAEACSDSDYDEPAWGDEHPERRHSADGAYY
ncbi:hypothetical protein COL154_002178 [Colletotrichum chrysophilum]|uniref:uncharacterized protein n=1 Tax=Colletotrichum chrysophilum TaxID=1836956 RepID=UPI0023007556|nr:uncharacterized protein COL26b_003190 [Colletotrichum chrysophilum]KAJ0354797.1 hypothetical protein KNSL1_001077 [Colletotrichum chrysophilum]KAJ0369292.1 hypothetical protein COL154_002178 [Colletotrichum chrysophilum]KAJ0378588.1 hypothetical protein COL26b_003190 [Colletotrichum chrysophilum]